MRWPLFLLGCLCVTAASAQGASQDDRFEQAMERSATGDADREEDDHGRALEADRILHGRYPVNSVDPDRLAEWVGLTPMQARQFRVYRDRFGPFIDLMELQAVPGWDLETVRRAIPWLRLGLEPRLMPLLRERLDKGRHQVIWRMSGSMARTRTSPFRPMTEPGHTGDGFSMLFRYRFQFRNLLQWGFAMEKDAGERFLAKSHDGPFDFQSFHAALRDVGKLESLVLGDFQVNMGQGLIHWQGLAFRKTADALMVLRQGDAVRPYQGADENRFHRGVAGTLKLGRLQVTAFAARDRLDGNLVVDSASPVPVYLSSLQTSGLHRTDAERHDKDAFGQYVAGATLTYRGESFHVSLNGIGYAFDVPLMGGDRPSDRGDVSGRDWSNLSFGYGWTLRNMHLFGEAAVDRRGERAVLGGLLLAMHSRVDLSILYRDIPPGYRALQAQAFTERSAPMNERGLYAGILVRPHPSWRLDAYADVFAFPGPSHGIDRPSGGEGFMVHLQWKPRKQVETSLRWQSERKESNHTCGGCNLRDIVPVASSGLRWQLAVREAGGIGFRSRVEVSRYSKGATAGDGFAAYVDLTYKPMGRPFSIAGRFCLFDTEGYDTRIYVYENDVPFSHSMSPLYGRGIRTYLLTTWSLSRGLRLSLRTSATGHRDPGPLDPSPSARLGRLDFKGQVSWEL